MVDDTYRDAYEDWSEAETDPSRLGNRFKVELAANENWDLTHIRDEGYEKIGEYADENDLSGADVAHIAKDLFHQYREQLEDISDTSGPAYGHLMDHAIAEGHATSTHQTVTYGDTDHVPEREPDSIEADWPTEIRRHYDEDDGGVSETTRFGLPSLDEDTEFSALQHVTPSITRTTVEEAIDSYVEEGGVYRPSLGVTAPRSPDNV